MIDLRTQRPISASKVCEFFDINRATLDRWFHLGLEHIKLGGRIYTTRKALKRFARPKRIPPRLQRRLQAEYRDTIKYLEAIGVPEHEPPDTEIDFNREWPVSVRRLSKVLEVTDTTIYRWFSMGLKSEKIGGKLYSTRAALNRFATRFREPDLSEKAEAAEQRAAEAYLKSIGV